MSTPTTVDSAGIEGAGMGGVALDAAGIRIDGQPRLLLCASLFYFRLPREQWRARFAQVRASGYTCVDVYLPWNFHETAPGRWSFDGRRDVAAFLDLAHAEGLHVLARPGPYICSEWDGGGLPAWLGLDPQLRIRQHEPQFLAAVSGWFDQVLPVLAERQHPAGPVIMVQLENELDFFDCADRTGYLTALRDLAVGHGITVPLIACAGQGDLAGATGDVPGIVPACNFYPDDDSEHIETEVRHYARLLAGRGLPLLVTETNRRHRTLRRLLAAGASLIGPYLQSSGWNFGYTPSVGNWGAPGNLMSHGYDFGGYVSSTGAHRPEFTQAQVLARVLDALGPRLALATPATPDIDVAANFPTSSSPAVLHLEGGGRLLALPNLGTAPGVAVLSGPSLGCTSVAVPADACPLLLLGLPLHGWGADLTLAVASADLVGAAGRGGAVSLAFSSEVPVTVVLDGLRIDGSVTGSTSDRVTVTVGAGPVQHRAVITGTDQAGAATVVTVVVLPPPDAARLATLHPDGQVELTPAVPAVTSADRGRPAQITTARRRTTAAPAGPGDAGQDAPPALESLGVLRGRGTYRTTVDLTGVDELLLMDAADLVDLSIAGQVRPTIAGFGAIERIDVRDVTGPAAIAATVEIWGHSNFDDTRLPALRLGALRGLGTVWAVTAVADVSACWTVGGADQWAGRPAPMRGLGGWSSTRIGVPIDYTRTLEISRVEVCALHLAGLATPVRVVVADAEPVTVHAENPWLLLPAGAGRVTVTMPHHPGGPRVRPELFHLRPVTGWSCTVQDDAALTSFAAVGAPAGEPVGLPLDLTPGEEAWLDVDLPPAEHGHLLRLHGAQLRATGWAAGECLGRVWLADPRRPHFSGGDSDVLWVPAEWMAAGTRLTLLLRGTAGPGQPVLHGISAQADRP